MSDVQYGKPNPSSGFPIEAFDLSGVGTAYIEGVGLCGWDPIDLIWRRVIVTTAGQLSVSGGGGGSGGGGVQYQELSYVNHVGTGNVVLGESTSGTLYAPTALPLSSSTAFVVAVVDSNGSQVSSFGGGGGGGGTTTVVQATAGNLNATVVGTITTVPSGTTAVSGTVSAIQDTSPWVTLGGIQVWGSGTAGTWTDVGYGTAGGTANLNVPVQVQAGTVTIIPSGTQVVNALQSTSPWVVSGTVAVSTITGGTITNVPSGTQTVAQSGSPWGVSGTVTAVESGTWSVTVSGTATTAPTGTQTVAGTVTTVPSGTQTVAGNFTISSATVVQATAANLNATIVGTVTAVPSGTTTITGTVGVSGTATVQPLPDVNTIATGSITASGSSVQISCAGLGNVIAVTSGVWSGTLAYQASADGVNWAAVNVYPSVPITGPVISTEVSNTSISFPVSGFNLFRVISVGWTSGTATVTINGDQAVYGVYDLNLAVGSATVTTIPSGTTTVAGTVTTSPSGTQTTAPTGTQSVAQTGSPWGVSGTVTAVESGTWQVGLVATTSNTIPSTYMNIAISTTGTNIKASAAALFGYYIANLGSAMSFVKLYNTNTTPTTTNVPIITIGIPGSGAANLSFPYGLPFSVGLGIYCSGSATSTDSTAPSGSVVANIFYA